MIHLLSIKYIYTFSDFAAVSKCFKGLNVMNLNSVV